jgi:hypothetical protein
VRRMLYGTGAFVVITVTVIGTQARWGWLHPAIAEFARSDPTIEAIDWTSLRDDLAARGLLRPGTVVGVPDWRDAGKIAYALGPGVTTVCLNRDCRQFGLADPPARFIGNDLLILAPEHPERVPVELGRAFATLAQLPGSAIRHAGWMLQPVAVFDARDLLGWPPQ